MPLQKLAFSLLRVAFQKGAVAFLKDLPETFENNTYYLIGNNKNPWVAAFLCPCGCKGTIQLNLLKNAHPCWSIKLSWYKGISISPSIWRTEGCQSHFWIRKGQVIWG